MNILGALAVILAGWTLVGAVAAGLLALVMHRGGDDWNAEIEAWYADLEASVHRHPAGNGQRR